MGVPDETAKEFRETHHTLLLGSEDISSIKSEIEAVKSEAKRSKKRGRAVLSGPDTSVISTKRKKTD
jgi:hypothetical protein